MSKMGRLSSVIIGCGAIAREHLSALKQLNNVEVAAVCDLSAARAEATAERFRIGKWYTDYQTLLDDLRPDMVHITTPPSAHFSIAKNCLAAGLNVLCEKPITVDYSDFRLLKQVATENRCMLMENQNLRFNSSIRHIQHLLRSGKLGDLLHVQIDFALNLVGPGSPYIDQNAPHFGSGLRGGIVGDFLPHIACLAYMFTGFVVDLRTTWTKPGTHLPLPPGEFRGLLRGERATAYVAFSANSRPNGYWIRVSGTKAYAEANLLEPPRIVLRRFRSGEPALMSLFDGIEESGAVLRGTVAGFFRKLGGTSSYDGLPELIARTYQALEKGQEQPIPLEEIDDIADLVGRFTDSELKL
jgi:predicted dehydrogenase